jgi:hypothetical protein
MNGEPHGLATSVLGPREHPIDNLDAFIASDTVEVEVNDDFDRCPLLDDASR